MRVINLERQWAPDYTRFHVMKEVASLQWRMSGTKNQTAMVLLKHTSKPLNAYFVRGGRVETHGVCCVVKRNNTSSDA